MTVSFVALTVLCVALNVLCVPCSGLGCLICAMLGVALGREGKTETAFKGASASEPRGHFVFLNDLYLRNKAII